MNHPMPSRQVLVAGRHKPSPLSSGTDREWRTTTRLHRRRPSPARLQHGEQTSVACLLVPCPLRTSGRSRRARSSRTRLSSSTFLSSGNRFQEGTATMVKMTVPSCNRGKSGSILVGNVARASLIHRQRIFPRPTLSLAARSWSCAREGLGCPRRTLVAVGLRTPRDGRSACSEGTTRTHRSTVLRCRPTFFCGFCYLHA